MIEQSFGLLFYLKKPKGFTAGEISIYLRITIDGTPVELSTKENAILTVGIKRQKELSRTRIPLST